jgi:hypothetical protein
LFNRCYSRDVKQKNQLEHTSDSNRHLYAQHNTETQGISGCSWRHAQARPVRKGNQRLETRYESDAAKVIHLLLDGVRVGRALGSVDDLIGQAPGEAVNFNRRQKQTSAAAAAIVVTKHDTNIKVRKGGDGRGKKRGAKGKVNTTKNTAKHAIIFNHATSKEC